MKKLFISLTAIAFFSFMAVQNQGDPAKAKEILKKTSTKFKAFKTISGDVSMIMQDQKNKTIENQKGNFKLKGNKFRIKMGAQEIFCNGTFIWTYLTETNECTKQKYKPKPGEISPSNLFTIYENGYDSYYIGDEKNDQVIDLVPTDKKNKTAKIKLYVNKKSSQISKAKIIEKKGNTATYTMTKLVPNLPIPDKTFEFNPKDYPKVEYTDLSN